MKGVENKSLKDYPILYIKGGCRKREIININNQSSNKNISIKYNMKTFTTFKLRHNEKLPSSEWSKDATKTYFINKDKWIERDIETLEADTFNNYGVPCGKTNNCWVLDLDFYVKEEKNPYDPDNCLFTKTFGNVEEYIKKNNILSVKTISGGFHLYFKYDTKYKQTTCKELHIDTRSDGGYVVAPYATINKNRYTFIDGDINPVPEDLGDFVLNQVINKKKKQYKPVNPKIKVVNPITNEEEEVNSQDIDLSVFKIEMTEYLMNNILKKLPDDYYFEDYQGFLIFTTAMKQLNMKKLWRKWAKTSDKYNKEGNELMWNSCNAGTYYAINAILLASEYKNARTALDYYKYKPTPKNTFIPSYEMDCEKLGYDTGDKPFFIIHNDRVVMIQSDTGTGKTTEAKAEFLRNQDKPFISIVSRISLGEEQVSIFKKAGLECDFHEVISEKNKREGRGWSSREGCNIVITIDSLMKLKNWNDFEGYTIFLDEVNSLIEYLNICPLLNKSRAIIKPLFETMIKQADKVICTDADINEITLDYMKDITPYKYIKNNYQHNSGVEAEEIFSFDSFIKAINEEKEWLIPCDSKTQSEIIGHINASSDYVLITSEGWFHSGSNRYLIGEERNLDLYPRVIYSPAIVYGLDSVRERPVYCYFREQTISPVAMIQQICRCRNIKYLRFLFTDKKCKNYTYHSPEHAQQEITDREQYGSSNNHYINEEGERILIEKCERYNNILAQYIYRQDCYDTNKFAHFINIIRSRGFKVSLSFFQTKQMDEKHKEDTQEEKERYFQEACDKYIAYYQSHKEKVIDPKEAELRKELEEYITKTKSREDYEEGDIEYEINSVEEEIKKLYEYQGHIGNFFSPSTIKINEILKIPYTEIKDYMELFMNPQELERHFNICKYFNNDKVTIEEGLYKKADYNPNKANTIEGKLLFLHKYRELLDMDPNIQNISVDMKLNEKQSDTFIKEYGLVFERFRGKKIPDFRDIKINQQYISKMYKNLFGKECINSRKTTKNKKSITIYEFNNDLLEEHNKVLSFRKKKDNNQQDCMIE